MNFKEYKAKRLQDPEFKQEYDDLAPEYELVRSLIENRKALKMTQKELAAKTGINQAHISRMESGNYNPSLKFLKRLAKGMGKELHVEFR